MKGPAGAARREGQSLGRLALNNLEGLLKAWRLPIRK